MGREVCKNRKNCKNCTHKALVLSRKISAGAACRPRAPVVGPSLAVRRVAGLFKKHRPTGRIWPRAAARKATSAS